MEFLVTAAQMKQCDDYTIHSTGIPSMVLMERAALSVAEEMEKEKCDMSSVLVICGAGNNGGDGFALARLLDERGIRVTVAFEGRESSLTEETFRQKNICARCGINPCSNYREREYTVIIDALFGVGLSRTVEGKYAELIEWMNRQQAFRVAVDIPSGIQADTGRIMGTAVRADLTVTFAYLKLGHILYPGTEYCGKVIRRDIGITADGLRRASAAFTYGEDDLSRVTPRNPRSHKGTYGKVLLVAGSHGMGGAAVLAARAAYRSGCGLVRIFTHESNRLIIQSSIPEAVVSTWENEEDLIEKLDEVLSWPDVIGIGPGLGRGKLTQKIIRRVFERCRTPLVVDADGLNELALCQDLLFQTEAKVVLTPHIGEMERFSGRPKSDILNDICACAEETARRYHVICVLKDARTVVTDGSRLYVNTSGNSGMATGGSGDVLTGLICGLLAQKMTLFEGTALGVYIHGLAGDLAARDKGAYGMLAGDIADRIGEVMKLAQDNKQAEGIR